MTESEKVIETWVEDRVGIIELARPEKFNCLSSSVAQAINDALDGFESSDEVRAILVRAQGKNFCTGADLDEVLALRETPDELREFLRFGLTVLSRLEAMPMPVVGAVQGLCLAGGLELMMACDVIFAGEDAQIGDQHSQYGLIPGWGGSQRLPRIIGMRRALDLFYSHRWISAADALSWGLVNYVTPNAELIDQAMDYCRACTERSRPGLAGMKRLAREGIEMSQEDGFAIELDLSVIHLPSDDAREGLQAFQDRRKPDFA